MRLKKFIEKNEPRKQDSGKNLPSPPYAEYLLDAACFEVCGGRGQWRHLDGRNTRAPPGKRQSARRRLDDSLVGSARAFERRRCVTCVRVFSHGFALKRYERASSRCVMWIYAARKTLGAIWKHRTATSTTVTKR